MSLYRPVSTQTWTDSKIVDNYTPDDRYFWLYLLTNPQTNLIGCYELPIGLASYQLGWSKEKVCEYIIRFCEVHETIGYDEDTGEIIIFNWHRYNWTASPKLLKSVANQVRYVKNDDYKQYFQDLVNGNDTVSIPYGYRRHTVANLMKDLNTCRKSYLNNTTKTIQGTEKEKDVEKEETEILADIDKKIKIAQTRWVEDGDDDE